MIKKDVLNSRNSNLNDLKIRGGAKNYGILQHYDFYFHLNGVVYSVSA